MFLLDAGDATQGIYFVTENEGEAAIEIMNALEYDAMALGNHEFDYGWFCLLQLMGDILTDDMRAVSDADIAMQNGGSIRDQELTAGDVTKAQLITVLPYGNVLQMAEVEGAVILECLEQSVSMYPDASGGFMQVSGLECSFDPAMPAGQRIIDVFVGGEALDTGATYTLCTNDFVTAGGDQYTMLVEPFSVQLPLEMPEYTAIENALIWYLEENQDMLQGEPQGRITVVE